MRVISIIVLLLLGVSGIAQPVLEFQKTLHDFGNIKEIDGPVSYDFVFTNTGNTPIIINNVESSCGCTSPEWTKHPVLPGKTGYIRAIFDPKDRPSFFDKTITVRSNAKNALVELKIKGNVESKVRTVLDDYPYEQPSGLRLPFDHIALMTVLKGEVKKSEIFVYNNAGKEVDVKFVRLPKHLKIEVEPSVLKEKGIAALHVEYDTREFGEFGLNTEELTLVVDGKNYPIRASIFIEEDLSSVRREIAPLIAVNKRYHNFGVVNRGEQVEFVFELSNTGKSPLKIHRCYSMEPSVELKLQKSGLLPGETTGLVVKIKKGTAVGKIAAMISVISDSPVNSELKLRFNGEIK